MNEIRKYESMAAAVAYTERTNWQVNRWMFEGSTIPEIAGRWRAGPSAEQIGRVSALSERIDAGFRDRTADTWVPSPFGAYPVVPDYLAGDPFSMRTKTPVESDKSPITFWIELGLSHNISNRDAETRAAALAALITRTAEDRPVEAKIICVSKVEGVGDVFVQIDIDAKIFDAEYITKCMVMREIVRPLRWALIADGRFTHGINWALMRGRKTDAAREQRIRAKFGCAPQDVVIQAALASDPDLEQMVRHPVKWVHKQIEKQRSLDNE